MRLMMADTKDWQELTRLTQGAPLVVERVRLADQDVILEGQFALPQLALGLLDRQDGRYRNTPATDRFLDRAKPSYIGGLLEMANSRLWTSWGALTEALRSGAPQGDVKTAGEDPFAALYADPASLEGFLRAMTGVSLPTAHALATTTFTTLTASSNQTSLSR